MIADRPEIIAIEKRRAEIDRREREHQEKAGIVRRYREDLERHHVEAARAAVDGLPIPPKPEDPGLVIDEHAPHEFLARRRQLDADRERALADLRPAIEEEAARREGERAARVKAAVATLQALADEAQADLREVRAVRQAVDVGDASGRATPGHGLADRTRSRIEVADLIEMATHGGSLLAVAPVPGRSEEEPHRDTSKRLDLGGGPFGTPYRVEAPPRLTRPGHF